MQGRTVFVEDDGFFVDDGVAEDHAAFESAVEIGGVGEHVGVLFAHGLLAFVE